jgi:ATP-dependent Clp protease ATP-binding subunit ClpA
MKFTLPIVVEAHPLEATRETEYRVRPVFIAHVEGRSKQLTRAISRLTAEVRKVLREVAKEQRHERLAEMVFTPELDGSRLSLTIALRRRSVAVKLLIVTLEMLGRTVAFAANLPELWFEVSRGEALNSRAEDVLTEHFRKKELEDGDEFIPPERYALASNSWVTTIDLDLHVPEVRKGPLQEYFATLGDGEVLEGAEELESVGHCLDRSYPDDLDRAALRDREVAELSRLLTAPESRPVLLLGPRQVGKTAIIHEAVFRKVDEHKDPYRNQRNVWHLSPQRLISGMSYVGQWENRLIAILKEAAEREHVLYFDDVLGLYVAGQCSSSSLSVANVLKPYVDRGEVRLLAELTPEAFRVLRERDRGFADLFHVIPVTEPSPADTLRVLLQTQRQLEERHDCSFEIDALPQVIDVTRRYARSEAFPGKGVRLLKRLAVATGGSPVADTREPRVATKPIDRRAVLAAFHEQSGLPLAFLDLDQKLAASEIADGLRRRFVGQDEAVRAAAEIIGIAKARLNDPDRPLASLLLLGPTGVGKTQFAKSLAAYLFGSDERLLRFDMNEYVSAASVPQLIGTFRNPEGLLTSAVRRSPFAVVLFDEIEKAHPDVFDLLLQVLGEGRLTDALGRTTDFTNTLILLTSNLGAQQSDTGLGFGSRDEHAKSASVKAAENFFRPEFFNRLDRVLPFDRLSRDDMRRVATLMIDDLFRRDGLTRRRVVPVVSPEAIEWIVSQGYEPVLGARALRRALDRELVRPIAAQLAAQPPSGLTVIQVNRAEAGLSATTQELSVAKRIPNSVATLIGRPDYDAAMFLEEAGLACRMGTLARPVSSESEGTQGTKRTEGTRTGTSAHPTETLPRAKECLARLQKNLDQLRPATALSSSQRSPEHERYFLLRERWQTLSDEWQLLSNESQQREARGREASPTRLRPPTRSQPKTNSVRSISQHGNFAREFDADEEIDDFLNEQAAGPELSESELQQRVGQLIGDLAWLDQISEPELPLANFEQRGILTLTFPNSESAKNIFEFEVGWLCEVTPLPTSDDCFERGLLIEGPLASRLLASQIGTGVCRSQDVLSLLRIGWRPLGSNESAADVWRERQSYGTGLHENATIPFGPLVIADIGLCSIDARSGMRVGPQLLSLLFSLSILASLPLPQEFVDAE